jgi:hypothetical protein
LNPFKHSLLKSAVSFISHAVHSPSLSAANAACSC